MAIPTPLSTAKTAPILNPEEEEEEEEEEGEDEGEGSRNSHGS
jgi:hypothetical protein